MKKRTLSLLLCLVMCLSLMPMSALADGLPVLNANISTGGILSWDTLEGAASYYWNIGKGEKSCGGNAETTSIDLNSKCESYGFSAGDYEVTLYARNSSNTRISEEWKGTFHYNSTQETLDAPTSLRVEDSICKWNAVTNATSYIVAFQDADGRSYGSATVNDSQYAIDPYNISLVDGQDYKFMVKASAAGYVDSEYSESALFTYSKPSTTVTLQNVTISGGILSWDALEGAASYYWNIGKGVKSCGGNAETTSIDLNSKCESYDFAAGDYEVTLFARNSSNTQISEEWKGTFHYTLKPSEYTVTVQNDGNGTASADKTSAAKDETVTLTVTPAEGYHFKEWQSSDVTVSGNTFTMPEKNVTVKAIFEEDAPNAYTVSFNMNGHGSQVTAQTVNEGVKATKPAEPTASGWKFNGWYTDATFSAAFDFNTAITADTTIYAKWTKNTTPPTTTYTVSFNMNGHGDQIAAQTVNEGAKATKPADPTEFGYMFVGWYKDSSFATAWNFDTDTVTADTTLYALWAQNTTVYTIIADANGEWTKGSTTGLAFTSDAPFDKFDSVKIDGTVIAAANYTAEAGSTKITLAPAYLETLSVGTHTIEIVSNDGSASVNFTVKSAAVPPVPTTYTVTFDMNGHGTQITAQTVESGSRATKPADPTAEGWTFGGWYADATFNVAFDFDAAINANTTVYAKWTENTVPQPPVPEKFTVSFNMNGHGTQVAEQTVEDGSKATKPTDPTASGYTFGGWYADATFSAKFDFNTAITANTTVYAKWTKNSVAPTDPTSPQTGDNSHMFLWIALLFVSGGALVGITVYGKKRKRAE